MYDIVILHGTFGHPFENWIPWLFDSLSSENKKVLVPQFPSPDGQSFESWEKILLSYVHLFNENTIFVGHSLGATFAVDFIVKHKLKLKKLFLISGLYKKIGIEEFDILNQSFFNSRDSLSQLKSYTDQILSIYSQNDPYLSFETLKEFADLCQAKSIIIESGGHFNKSAGYEKFHELLELILR